MQLTPEKIQKARRAFDSSRKGTLWTARNKTLAFLALVYLISPVDLVPDWLFPAIGWLDDLGVIALVALWINRHRGIPAPEEPHDPESTPRD